MPANEIYGVGPSVLQTNVPTMVTFEGVQAGPLTRVRCVHRACSRARAPHRSAGPQIAFVYRTASDASDESYGFGYGAALAGDATGLCTAGARIGEEAIPSGNAVEINIGVDGEYAICLSYNGTQQRWLRLHACP